MPGGRAGGHPVDVLIVSLGSTQGLRTADEQLGASLERAGARVALACAQAPAPVRTLMLTDLAWARSARTAAARVLAQMGDGPPRAIVYSSTTAALLWPRPGAIRFDALAAGNRPARHGLWQRPLERRRLAQAPLLLPWSDGAMQEAPAALGEARALVLPVAVASSGPPAPRRDIAAITYAANPAKKGLGRVLEAWRRLCATGPPPGELVVAGAPAEEIERAGLAAGGAGVRVVGALAREEYRALLRRARVFVCAPRREDYGIAQLEALADGCLLVTTPAPGPYAALALARALDERLVGEDLVASLRSALEDPSAGYAERAREALAPFGAAAIDRLIAEQVLPRLLGEAPQL
ncbi:MAG TPA: glycosyltransferase [Solirubrobacteraceae bacterium]|nr:glycosyltransferase [Solirubrobacteraceae bacterium]